MGSAMSDTVRVELGARSYDIRIGRGLIDEADGWVAPLWPAGTSRRQAPIVVDAAVAEGLGARLHERLTATGIEAPLITVPSGEASKCWRELGRVVNALLDSGVERSSRIIALGGGVIGDLAGFAAAITLRGLDVIQIPTTLLSQVDSSVGGKTGIDTRHGKNLIGAFHQPSLVLADLAALDSLPARHWRAGYAEIVKYGCIDRPDFFDWLENRGRAVLDGEPEALAHAVAESCRAKADTVAADERETGRRALLNLGHTFGHALEADLGYSERLLHGEAVAIGMVLAFRLSVHLGLCPPQDEARLTRHLSSLGLPTSLPPHPEGGWSADRLIGHMAHDKKVRDGRLTFVLVRGIGQAFISQDVPVEALSDLIEGAIAA
jgi:3-dehydroquinate synthase